MTSHQVPNFSQHGDQHNNIVIIGAGIVGSAVANYLSERSKSKIIVIDSSIEELQGSTGHAPGFVGQFNELAPLTELAKDTVNEYLKIAGGFDSVGGLEVASSPEGVAILEQRYQLAQLAGLPARLLSSAEASELAPLWLKPDSTSKALYFPSDGTANPRIIVHAHQQIAKSRGVVFVEAKALSLVQRNGRMTEVKTSIGTIKTECVVVATGIWTQELLNGLGIDLPIVPVAHPYAHGPQRPPRAQKSPFIRWPEAHVYARDHGLFDGFGSYGHPPIVVETLGSSAIEAWELSFGDVLAKALSLFPHVMSLDDSNPFNGVFAVTPDGLPFAGCIENAKGLWIASAIWVTHAAGVAKLLARAMTEGAVDDAVSKAINPNRFMGQDSGELKKRALSTYNNIYNKSDYES